MKNRISVSGRNVAVHSFFVLAALLLMGGCRMPFDWSLDVPGDWGMDSGSALDGDATTGTSADGQAPVLAPESSGATEVRVVGDRLSLFWDESTESANEYRIYYRAREESSWILLVGGLREPSTRINRGDIPHGSYEFAVSYVDETGVESALHTSLDTTADPGTGWFVTWTPA